ncbi:hypothetical protein LTR36_008571 [Oleoguttula mirabilis]|uniref:PNPLA domain-containing protein n=1 Tax=Oleoguttula mirabilis TaxID=1507867 RepID=A0AAV9JTF2_9PEZI|nr:hypothetical protein LTR36_008571 [Oleoguttula mirabilis]
MRRRAETGDSEKAGRVWAREVDDAWDPCILTLDGGGIRGYSSLMILKALMHEIWLVEQRLDNEEEIQEREGQYTAILDSPLDGNDQAAPGAKEERGRRLGENGGKVGGEVGGEDNSELEGEVFTGKKTTEEELLPCHYFDFMYGTSTGGLISTMLGRLRMTVSECLELYRKVGEDLFGKQRSRIPLTTKYYHQPLERAVQDIVGARCHEHPNCNGKDDMHPWEVYTDDTKPHRTTFDINEPRVCQSCCLTATHDENISEAYLLRSYPHFYGENAPNWITRYNEGADELPIWKVTRATSAAPFYFEMISHEVEGVTKSFKDGGIRENNPSGAALSEFHALYGEDVHQPALLLSVGTGRPDQSQDGFASTWPGPFGRLPFVSKFLEKRAVIQNLLIKYTEGEKQHHQMREHAHGEHTWYKRLNVSHGLETMPLDDWRKGDWQNHPDIPGGASLSHMEEVTAKYLEREFNDRIDSYAPPSIMLKQAAEKLVRQRRAREQEGGERWETFIGKHLHRASAEANGNAT